MECTHDPERVLIMEIAVEVVASISVIGLQQKKKKEKKRRIGHWHI